MQELLLHFNYESQDEQEVVNIHTHIPLSRKSSRRSNSTRRQTGFEFTHLVKKTSVVMEGGLEQESWCESWFCH